MLTCHDSAASPTFPPGELVAALFERENVPSPAFVLGAGDGTEPSASSFTCDGSGRSSTAYVASLPAPAPKPAPAAAPSLPVPPLPVADDDDEAGILAELFGDLTPPPPPPPVPTIAPCSSRKRSAGGSGSLHFRLQSVMAQRRSGSVGSSSASASATASVHSEPVAAAVPSVAASASGRGFVMSRFLSSTGQAERRLPAYSEDRHLLKQGSTTADATAPTLAPANSGASSEPQLKRVRTEEARISLLDLVKSSF